MSTAVLAPDLYSQYLNQTGTAVAAGYKLFSYVAGTSTKQPTYLTSTLNIGNQNSNPIILAADGSAQIWLDPSLTYKFVLAPASDADPPLSPIWTRDYVPGWDGGSIINTVLASIITANYLGSLLYPRTEAEVNAGVTPSTFIYPELDLRRYGYVGAGGTSDSDYLAITSAIAAAEQYGAATIIFPANSVAVCNTGLTWDIAKVSLDGNGTTLDFSGLASGQALVPLCSQTDPNLAPLSANVHPMENFIFIGPGVSNLATIGLLVASASASIAGAVFRNLSFREFSSDIVFQANTFCCTFINCLFTQTLGTATTFSVIQNSVSNNGERVSFVDCWWYNRQLFITNVSGTADIYVRGGSMDGCVQAVLATNGGSVFLSNVHIESGSDINYWFSATINSSIFVDECYFVLDASKPTFPIFYTEAANSNGGIFLGTNFFGFGANNYAASYAPYGPTLIAGAGNCSVGRVVWFSDASHPGTASSLGILAYPGFESGNYTNEWTLSGGAVRSSAHAHTGSWSLALPAVVGTNSVGRISAPCKPGQYAVVSYWYLLPTIVAAGGQLAMSLEYLDKGGAILSVTSASITVNNTSWLNVNLKSQAPAPFGTASVQVVLQTAVAVSSATGYIDDVLFTVF